MTAFLILPAVIAAVWLAYLITIAPDGFEDSDGWHAGSPDAGHQAPRKCETREFSDRLHAISGGNFIHKEPSK